MLQGLVYDKVEKYFGTIKDKIIKNSKTLEKYSSPVEISIPFLIRRYSLPCNLIRLEDKNAVLNLRCSEEKQVTFPDKKYEKYIKGKYSLKSRNNILYLKTLIDEKNARYFKRGIVSIGKSPIEMEEFDYFLKSLGIR
jgi:hypothetical protein